MTATTLERTGKLVHDAFFYTDASSYRAGLLNFIRAGLANDEPVLVAVPQPGLGLVRSALTEDEEARVRTRDMSVAGRNPGRIIGTVLSAFVREHAGRRVRIIGEPIWAGRSSDEYPACAEHEALINVALGRVAGLHPVPVRRHPSRPVGAGRRHPDAPDAGLRAGPVGQSRLHRLQGGGRLVRPAAVRLRRRTR